MTGSPERRGRLYRSRWRGLRWFRHLRSPVSRAVPAALILATVLLLWLGHPMQDYSKNVAINVGADLVGAMVTIFVITPLIAHSDEGRVREHPRLDYLRYVERVAGATSAVRILDTFSNLLDGPLTDRFFLSARRALEREAVVQILLLDPDSLAVQQRAEELDDPDIRREILRNMRALTEFAERIAQAGYAPNFEVRLYNASPSISLYRWDERSLVSFFPIGRLSGQGAQLEVAAQSPLGQFVNDRFNALWLASRGLAELMALPLVLLGDPAGEQELEAAFVLIDGVPYVSDHRVVAHMARRKGRVAVRAGVAGRTAHHPAIVDGGDAELLRTLRRQFQEKYGRGHDIFVCLAPADQGV